MRLQRTSTTAQACEKRLPQDFQGLFALPVCVRLGLAKLRIVNGKAEVSGRINPLQLTPKRTDFMSFKSIALQNGARIKPSRSLPTLQESLDRFGETMSAIQFLEEINGMLALPQSAMARTVLLAKQKQLEYEMETWRKLQTQ